MRRDADFFEPRRLESEQSGAGTDTAASLTPGAEAAPAGQLEVELPVVYLAKRLRESLKVEELLTAHGIDYLVETGPYAGGFLFRRQLTGAYFYVAEADLERTRSLLSANGYSPAIDL